MPTTQPLPQNYGDGEGQLKPIAVKPTVAQEQPASYTPAATPPPQPTAQPPQPSPAPQQPIAAPQQPSMPPSSIPRPAAAPAAKRPAVSLSIKGLRRQAEEAPQQAIEEKAALRAEPYTYEALVSAWTRYTELHPTERILVNTMLAVKPQHIDADRYFVAVDDAIQVEAIYECKDALLKHLRDTLRNDHIDFEARITQGEASPVTWTQREVLEHMAASHPALQDFIQKFGLSLA